MVPSVLRVRKASTSAPDGTETSAARSMPSLLNTWVMVWVRLARPPSGKIRSTARSNTTTAGAW